MVKFRTVGCIEVSKNNPVLTHSAAVKNGSIFVSGDDTYLIWNTINGDDSYKDDVEIPAGKYLNGFNLSANIGQELVVDAKHITNTYATLAAGDAVTFASTYLVGTPTVSFTAVAKTQLTGDAVIVKIGEVAASSGD